MTALFQDLRAALRALRATPAVTLAILVSLGLGIGGVVTAFAWYEGWVLRPMPHVAAQDRLTWINTRAPGGSTWSVSYPTSLDWREQTRTLEDLATFSLEQVGLRVDGSTERLFALMVSANYFDFLGVRPVLGRSFRPEEERGAVPVAVLGHAYWRQRFEADSGIVGRALNLAGTDYTVIGVAPPRFGGSYPGLTFDIFLPVTTLPYVSPQRARQLQQRGSQWLEAFGRLAPGVTLTQAQAEADAIGKRLEAVHPGEPMTPVLTPLAEAGPSGTLRPVLLAQIGITALVLLIACANVANLLLARGAARQREIGIRLAVGAARGQVIRQLLTESLLLAVAGGALGLAIAWWGRNLMMAFIPPSPFPLGSDLTISPRVVAVAAAVTLGTVLVFGLVPALRASRPDLVPALRDGAAGSGTRSRLRGALVTAQVALSLVALVAAGLFVRGLQRAGTVETGYADPDRLLLVDTNLRLAGTLDETSARAVLDRAVAHLETVAGVRAVATAQFVPLGFGNNSSNGIAVEGYQPAEDENMSVQFSVVTPGYFATVGIPIVQGRDFTTGDRADGAPVAVVNEAFVRRFLAGADPVGRRFRRSGRDVEIVGVARDAKYQRLEETAYPFIYLPQSQNYRADVSFHIRTAGDPAPLVETLRRELAAVAPDLPFLDPRTLTQQMVPATLVQRIGAGVLGIFGGIALLLSAVGIYGVVAYSVAQRTRELGVRLALGATPGGVIRLVVGQGLRLTALGLAIGGLLALGAGRLLQSQLFGLNPADPVTFGSLILLLAGIAIAASLVPARRASRVNPVEALREG